MYEWIQVISCAVKTVIISSVMIATISTKNNQLNKDNGKSQSTVNIT